MATTSLPPPPINDKPGSFTWLEWYRQLRDYIKISGSVPWYLIDFAGSDISDIATRIHNNLQSVQGGAAGEKYHLTTNEYNALTTSIQGTWTPTFTDLITVPVSGTVTITGRYSKIGRTVFFTVHIIPDAGVTVESTGTGVTYFNYPSTYVPAYNDILFVSNDLYQYLGTGFIDSSTTNLYTSTWGPEGNPITISGKYEV